MLNLVVSQPQQITGIVLSDREKAAQARPHIGQPAPGKTVSVDTPLHEVQRPLHEASIRKYINKIGTIDWNMFGYVTVVEYPDGSQRVIDGQHRISLVKTLSPGTKQVPAHIIKINNTEDAAQYFAFLNGVMIRKITNEELLWAEVIARDPDALNTFRVLQRADLSCGQVNPGFKKVKRVVFEKCIKLSEENTVLASKLIKQAYPNNDNIDLLLHGLVHLLSVPEDENLSKDLTLGKMFKEWFVERLPEGRDYKDACFKQYQNNSQWQIGIAYGLMEVFDTYMKRKGKSHQVPALKFIRDSYLKGLN